MNAPILPPESSSPARGPRPVRADRAPAPGPPGEADRRRELAAFLRTRRARLKPEDVGLPGGRRRRTPGLRREEVAHLSRVSVTWYTWLEQARPIKASEQVLHAVARTLRLNATERLHLLRLAEAGADDPQPYAAAQGAVSGADMRTILDSMTTMPAAVYSTRFDVVMHNAAYRAMFPSVDRCPPGSRNVLWWTFTEPEVYEQFANARQELPHLVGMLRADYARHLGEPEWEQFIARLRAASGAFARLWSRHDVSQPGSDRTKVYRYGGVGDIRVRPTCLALTDAPEHRLLVLTPRDGDSTGRLAELMARAR
jgi:hypothetical protein